ncbi:tannase/feruloyl esterase family alpha/beta hydrolase [Alteromonas pelagimontana]|uniref:Tannase/feruloyl esterase family alpha/beta hydrolase n=1 Tax=Alteromonas pelagimontana TaxID=1858656 RepID=A0A6M4ME04_9ALTE|nr:tannase/feruloyl esterase family alpha/beta hydrolase [Alteromonas pelagimontana]QJR81068.1 tannase/feruloyl esterase family alpha/beta hydrolase [Alteromonas pelagimontana]
MRALTGLIAALLSIFNLYVQAQENGGNCHHLKDLKYPSATIVSATSIDGQCRVEAKIWPPLSQSDASYITLHVWLPELASWNGRFLGVGNGGYSSKIPTEAMAKAAQEGFAVAATDTGHQSDSLSFAIEAPERIDYWGRTSVHELSHYGTQITHAFYDKAPEYKYFQGCSTGGHQALAAAQFYPEDYDGIVAGAPGHNRVALNAAFLWLFQQTHLRENNEIVFTQADLALLESTFLKKCDAQDGKRDGLLSNPHQCRPDLTVMQCKNNKKTQQCFTASQIIRINNILEGPTDPETGKSIYPGFPPGSENASGIGWRAYWADPEKPDEPARADFWRIWAFQQDKWDPWEFDWHADFKRAKHVLSPRIDATQTNLRPFFKQGGKLIIYHGMADPIVSYLDSLSYAREVAETTKLPSLQLYLIPGMSHCAGGKGVTYVNPLPSLIEWVEKGTVPQSLPGKRIIDGHTVSKAVLRPESLQ